MRFQVPIMAGGLVLVGLVSTNGGWTATFEEIREEMNAAPISKMPARGSLSMGVPMLFSGTTGMPLTDLCVSEGTIRPKDPSKASMSFGKVREGNLYSVPIHYQLKSTTGDNISVAERKLELPACK